MEPRTSIKAIEAKKDFILIFCTIFFVSFHLGINMTTILMGRYWGFTETIKVFSLFLILQTLLVLILCFFKIDRIKSGFAVVFLCFFLFQYVLFVTPHLTNLTLILYSAGTFATTTFIFLFRPLSYVALCTLLTCSMLFCSLNGGKIAYEYAKMRYDLSSLPPKTDLLANAHVKDKAQAPDIFIIFQDSMGDFFTINRMFGHDSGNYKKFLEENGFYIASDARSYYTQTLLSISSTLNMNYLQDDLPLPHAKFYDNRPAVNHYLHPRLFQFLMSQGYEVHMSTSAYNVDSTPDQHITDLRARDFNIGGIENAIGCSVFYPILNLVFGGQRTFLNPYRDFYNIVREQYEFLRIQAKSGTDRPRLVYFHAMTPHPPFVFAANGDLANYPFNDVFAYKDGVYHQRSNLYEGGWNRFYIKAYAEQVAYSQMEIMSVIEAFKDRQGDRPYVIVIQGDHGSRSHRNFASLERTDKTELFGITNLIYFSDGDYSSLQNDISPINTMRVIMNKYFDAQLPMLENQNWYSTWDRPYDFLPVSDAEQRAYDLYSDTGN